MAKMMREANRFEIARTFTGYTVNSTEGGRLEPEVGPLG